MILWPSTPNGPRIPGLTLPTQHYLTSLRVSAKIILLHFCLYSNNTVTSFGHLSLTKHLLPPTRAQLSPSSSGSQSSFSKPAAPSPFSRVRCGRHTQNTWKTARRSRRLWTMGGLARRCRRGRCRIQWGRGRIEGQSWSEETGGVVNR